MASRHVCWFELVDPCINVCLFVSNPTQPTRTPTHLLLDLCRPQRAPEVAPAKTARRAGRLRQRRAAGAGAAAAARIAVLVVVFVAICGCLQQMQGWRKTIGEKQDEQINKQTNERKNISTYGRWGSSYNKACRAASLICPGYHNVQSEHTSPRGPTTGLLYNSVVHNSPHLRRSLGRTAARATLPATALHH